MKKENRRSFVKKATLASAVTTGGFLNLNPSALGANEKVVMALIGGKNRGRQIALEAIRYGGEFKTFCDIDEAVLRKVGGEMEKAQKKPLGTTDDYREVLNDKDIDAVMIATPDHWHAIQTIHACQAGKDIYIEKPLSHTIHEGHMMRNAARKYNRIVQMGTQRRSSNHFRSAIEYVASGKLGKICLVKSWACQIRGSIGNPPDGKIPGGVDYDKWLGPAPKRPFNPMRFHYNWRFFWDYCNSEEGNQGVHGLDICMWGIAAMRGLENCLPTHVSGLGGIYWLDDCKEVPDMQVVSYDYGDFMLLWELRSFQNHHPQENTGFGSAFYGVDASLVISGNGWKVYPKDGGEGPSEKSSGGSHPDNFMKCVKSRKRPNAEIEVGRLSTTICHLGNITYHLGRDVVFDPKTETFGDDKEANALLTKKYRAPYTLPAV